MLVRVWCTLTIFILESQFLFCEINLLFLHQNISCCCRCRQPCVCVCVFVTTVMNSLQMKSVFSVCMPLCAISISFWNLPKASTETLCHAINPSIFIYEYRCHSGVLRICEWVSKSSSKLWVTERNVFRYYSMYIFFLLSLSRRWRRLDTLYIYIHILYWKNRTRPYFLVPFWKMVEKILTPSVLYTHIYISACAPSANSIDKRLYIQLCGHVRLLLLMPLQYILLYISLV